MMMVATVLHRLDAPRANLGVAAGLPQAQQRVQQLLLLPVCQGPVVEVGGWGRGWGRRARAGAALGRSAVRRAFPAVHAHAHGCRQEVGLDRHPRAADGGLQAQRR